MDVETARGVTPQPLRIRRSRRERMRASRKHLFTGDHHACWNIIDAHTLPRHLRPLNRSVSAQYPLPRSSWNYRLLMSA
jgi:hypothetical protein